MTARKWKPGVPITWKDMDDYTATDFVYDVKAKRAMQIGFIWAMPYCTVKFFTAARRYYTAVKIKENVCQKKQQ